MARPLRNKIDLSLPPDALFLNPWQDAGIQLARAPKFLWRAVPKGRIEGFAASVYPDINRKIERFLKADRQRRRFGKAIEYEAVPAVLEDASFRKSFIGVRGRLLMTGAAATRLINRYIWENEGNTSDPTGLLGLKLKETQAGNFRAELTVNRAVLETDLPFAIECRNTYNYYHFITESLAQLTVLDGLDFQGDIYFHFPNPEEKQRAFVKDFAEALFPEYTGRMHFERAPKDYDQVLTAFELIGAHYQMPHQVTNGMKRHVPSDISAEDRLTDITSRNVIAKNATSMTLSSLRERALDAIEGQNFDHLPKRFFVGRDDRKSRARGMAGEDLLFEHLELFGFEYVVFESLSPLEQVALMANAEMMVSYHGAGFTNMLFANEDAWVIEIGTLQTAQYRWGDFWPLAHVSQCHYISYFADFDTENPSIEPVFNETGIAPISLSEKATAQILAFIVTVLGHYPELRSHETLAQVAQQVLMAEAPEQALGVLDAHPNLVGRYADLAMIKADCHKSLGEPKSELVALDMAYKSDRSRWRTLIRMIWCANTCDRPQVIRWALSRLEIDFPDRYNAFVGNHEWVRHVA